MSYLQNTLIDNYIICHILAPTNGSSVNGLTMEAVQKHEAIQSFSLRPDPIVNSLSGSLKSFSLYDDGDDVSRRSMSQATSFASNFSACSNMSFNKLVFNLYSNNVQI